MGGNARPGLDKRKRRPRVGWLETPHPPLILNLLKDGQRVFCCLTITPPAAPAVIARALPPSFPRKRESRTVLKRPARCCPSAAGFPLTREGRLRVSRPGRTVAGFARHIPLPRPFPQQSHYPIQNAVAYFLFGQQRQFLDLKIPVNQRYPIGVAAETAVGVGDVVGDD